MPAASLRPAAGRPLDVARAPAPAPPGAGSRVARQPLRPRQSAAGTAPAAPIGCRSAPERATQARRAVVNAPRTAPTRPAAPSPRPGSPAQRPRRGDQHSMACSRCGSTAVQRPSAPCRCPLRATATCMSASAQPGSRSAARHQRRSAPRCGFAGGFDRSGGPAATPSARSAIAQGPPAGTPRPPLSSRPRLPPGAPSAAPVRLKFPKTRTRHDRATPPRREPARGAARRGAGFSPGSCSFGSATPQPRRQRGARRRRRRARRSTSRPAAPPSAPARCSTCGPLSAAQRPSAALMRPVMASRSRLPRVRPARRQPRQPISCAARSAQGPPAGPVG